MRRHGVLDRNGCHRIDGTCTEADERERDDHAQERHGGLDGERRDARDRYRRTADRRYLVMAQIHHRPPRQHRSRCRHQHDRNERETGFSRGEPVHNLEIEGHIHGEPQYRSEHPRSGGRAGTHHRIPEHRQR